MGLSTKQVSGDGLDWSQTLLQSSQSFVELPKPPPVTAARRQQQQNQEQVEQLKCPRCESTNTKFCYYNNYNKTQPRHFCRACKRHWTRGGTLRNVPVGGHGRKNKRTRKPTTSHKLPSSSSSSSAAAAKTTTNGGVGTTNNNTNLTFEGFQRLNTTHVISSSELDSHIFSSSSSSSGFSSTITTMPFNFLHHQGGSRTTQVLNFPHFSSSSTTTSCSFDTFQSPSALNYPHQDFKSSTITSVMPSTTSTISHQPNNSSVAIGMYTAASNDWNWEDIETLVSTDLNVPWDDSDMKL